MEEIIPREAPLGDEKFVYASMRPRVFEIMVDKRVDVPVDSNEAGGERE